MALRTIDVRKAQVAAFDNEMGNSFATNILGVMAERPFTKFVIETPWVYV